MARFDGPRKCGDSAGCACRVIPGAVRQKTTQLFLQPPGSPRYLPSTPPMGRRGRLPNTPGGQPMQRQLLFVAASAWLFAIAATPVGANTSFKVKGVNVSDKWIIHQTNQKLNESPGNILDDKQNKQRFGTLDSEEALARLWKAWRTDEPPKVDFTKSVVLVLTHFENAQVEFTADLDDKGDLKLNVSSTEREANGMTYVIAVVDRAKIKSINGMPIQPEK